MVLVIPVVDVWRSVWSGFLRLALPVRVLVAVLFGRFAAAGGAGAGGDASASSLSIASRPRFMPPSSWAAVSSSSVASVVNWTGMDYLVLVERPYTEAGHGAGMGVDNRHRH